MVLPWATANATGKGERELERERNQLIDAFHLHKITTRDRKRKWCAIARETANGGYTWQGHLAGV